MKKEDSGERAASLLANLRRIIHAIHAQSSTIEAAVGVTAAQLWALREINRSLQGLALSELAERLVLHRANAGRLVDKLVAKKLVRCERPANDLRYVLVRVTSKGRALAERPVGGPAQADLLARIADLPEDEVARIDAALASLVRLLGAQGVEPAPLFEAEKSRRRRTRARG